MKKLIINSFLPAIVIILLVTACEKDIIMMDSSKYVVGFSASDAVIRENLGGPSPIMFYVGAATGTENTDVTFSVDTAGMGASGAKEGIDFTIAVNPVSAGVGISSVNIVPVDNDVFTGNKKFYLVIASNSNNYRISAQKHVLVTIADDEHPLKSWIGAYTVSAVSYGSPGSWDETWNVITLPVEGNLDQLSITGLGYGSTVPVIATLDKTALTISIESGQLMGEAYGPDNGAVKLYFGTSAIIAQVLAGVEITSSMLTEAATYNITGTLEADGTIHLDKMGMVLTDYDWCWDVFNTTWAIQ
jgi:hypothetical protein